MGGYDVRCVEVSAHLSNQHIVSPLRLILFHLVPSRKLFMILVNSEELIMLL